MDANAKIKEDKNSLLVRYRSFSAEAKGIWGVLLLCFLLLMMAVLTMKLF